MGKPKIITPEMIAEYEKVTGVKIHLDKNIPGKGKNVFETTNKDGSKGAINITQIPHRLDHYRQLALQKKIENTKVFRIVSRERQIKKKWKIASCPMTIEEYAELKKIAESNNLTVGALIRQSLLFVIENERGK